MKIPQLVLTVIGCLMLNAADAQAQKSWNPMELWARKHESYSRALPATPAFTSAEIATQEAEATALMTSIEAACKSGVAQFVIPPGNYRFNGLQPTVLAGLQPTQGRFRIIARGVTFWFARPASDATSTTYGLQLRDCSNITIKGLSIDFDPVTWTQGQVTHIDPRTRQLTVSIDPGYPLAVPGDGAVVQFYHANGRFIPRLPSGLFSESHAEVTDPLLRQVTVTLGKGQLADDLNPINHSVWKNHFFVHTGDCVVLPYRTAWAVDLAGCSAVHIEHTGIYDSPGMGILEDGGQGHNVFDHVRIVRRPGTNRLYACCADGIHSRLMAHGPIIENCEISCNGDDIINLHGYFALVVRQTAPNRFVVASYADQKLQPAQSLSFYRFHQVSRISRTPITSVIPDGNSDDTALAAALAKKLHIILPDGPLRTVTVNSPVICNPGTLINTHADQSAGFVIKNCYFHDSLGRCLLLNGACNGIVANNIWRNIQNGACLHMESWYYLEGPFCHDIIMEQNRWDHCAMGVAPQWSGVRGLLYAGMVPAVNYLRNSEPLYNLTFTGNHIDACGGAAICVSNVRNVQITDNVITRSYMASSLMDNWKPAEDYYQDKLRGEVYVAECSGVTIAGNRTLPPGEDQRPMVQVGKGDTQVVVDGGSENSPQLVKRDLYTLSSGTGKLGLTVAANSVVMRPIDTSHHYAWLVTPMQDGSITISSISATTLYLTLSQDTTGTRLIAAPEATSNAGNERWLVTPCGDGAFRLSPATNASLALTLSTSRNGPSADLTVWNDSSAQQWTLTKSNLDYDIDTNR